MDQKPTILKDCGECFITAGMVNMLQSTCPSSFCVYDLIYRPILVPFIGYRLGPEFFASWYGTHWYPESCWLLPW